MIFRLRWLALITGCASAATASVFAGWIAIVIGAPLVFGSAVLGRWPRLGKALTFTAAANQAGISRRYGGIHYELADLVGRATGRLVAEQAWQKALMYFNAHGDSRLNQTAR